MFVCLHTHIDTNIYASVCLKMQLNAAQMQLHLRPNTATIVNKESRKKKTLKIDIDTDIDIDL